MNSLSQVFSGNNNAQFYEAGFVQRREWMLYKIREDHYPMNIQLAFDLNTFDHDSFQKVIDLLVEKHEVLRTTLKVIDGSLNQVVHDSEHFRVKYAFFNVIERDEAGKKTILKEKMYIQYHLPFNIEYGPLFRITVFSLSETNYKVSLVFHHVIFDQYSIEIFRNEAAQFFRVLNGEDMLRTRMERVQYRTYSAFENELLDTELGDAHRAYWRAQLSRFEPGLAIIEKTRWSTYYDKLGKKVQAVRKKVFSLSSFDHRFIASVVRRYESSHAGMLQYQYTADTFQNILEFRRKCNSSLHAVFVAGFLIGLQKLSGQKLFVIDIPASRRVDGKYKHIIGWLAAGGICIFDMNENLSTSYFLDYIDRQLYLLAQHCIYPFETLSYESEIPAGSTVPIFFNLTEASSNESNNTAKEGILMHSYEGDYAYQNLDIWINVYTNSCNAMLKYNNFLISPRIIEQLIATQEVSMNRLIQDVLSGADLCDNNTATR